MKELPVWKTLLRLCPPVMLALLIQSVYNIVDSYFVAQYSADGLTALSIIYPVQLLMTAIATGTGAGINILISRMEGSGRLDSQKNIIKSGLFLGVFNYLVFTALGLACLEAYCELSSQQVTVQVYSIEYGRIIFVFSLGMFLEAHCTKLLQAKGNMLLPMYAQIFGALVNVLLDPLLIYGYLGFPALGACGAAIATAVGQWCAMLIVLVPVLKARPLKGKLNLLDCVNIYKAGLASIVMQSLYTLYMVGLNLILKQFTEHAVTVLGIYYKLQTFFFIPLMGLQQVILPVISFNYGARRYERIDQTLRCSIGVSLGVMLLGCSIFMAVPKQLLSIFSTQEEILEIGSIALRVISVSFIPAAFVIMLTVYFQGVNKGLSSISITLLRQVVLLVPLAWLFHYRGLSYVWFTFPVTEITALLFCLWLYKKKTPTSSLCPRPDIESEAA